MATKIFVNLPVKDLQKSMAFFSRVGFTSNSQFTNESGACMIVSEEIYVMLLAEKFFRTFTSKQLTDTSKSTEVIVALGLDSKQKVDELGDRAMQAGAGVFNEPQDQGVMYTRSFQDLDGHLWEIFYIEQTAAGQ